MSILANKLAEQAAKESQQPPHLIIEALAGTGKTTTLTEGLKVLKGEEPAITPSPQQQAIWESLLLSEDAHTIGFCAFNSSIAKELQKRVPKGVDARTMHSLGLRGITASFGRLIAGDEGQYRVQDIMAEIEGVDIRELRKKSFDVVRAADRLVQLVKMNLIEPEDGAGWELALDALVDHYEVELEGQFRNRVYDLVPQIIERCKDVDRDRRIDFNDMIWLPVVLNLHIPQMDLLLVDECQDLNRCQQALAKKAGRRMVFCGDKNQAIYGFAGADAKSMDRLKEELGETPRGCQVLPLTVTRRCGKAIVQEAKQYVPRFEAHETNPGGAVHYYSLLDPKALEPEQRIHEDVDAIHYLDKTEPGDMILCRANSPLVREFFRILKAGKKASIQGSDIGKGLVTTIRKLMKPVPLNLQQSVPELMAKVTDWKHEETEAELAKRTPDESKINRVRDRADCIVMFAQGKSRVDDIIYQIERIFTDQQSCPGLKLSTIHKAKGLEARRVFFIDPFQYSKGKGGWKNDQEKNLRYVAITRAIEELVYVR